MTKKWIRRGVALLALTLFLDPAGSASGEDWPQWRGPHRDGVWRETGIVDRLPEGELPRRWTAAIGSGYSGPTVAEGRVYAMDRQVDVVEGKEREFERVLCFDADTGDLLWQHRYEAPYEIGYRAGPRASVTIHDGLAYAVGAMGHFHCLDAASGELRWKHDLDEEYGIEMPIWGIAGSPLIYKQLVIQIVGGSDGACVVAFDRISGREAWRALNDQASYTSPILIRQADQDVLVCWTGDTISGLDPADGRVHWSYPMPPSRMPIGIATPVVENERLFVTSFYDGSAMLRVPKDRLAAEELWRKVGLDEQRTEALHSIISTPVLTEKYVYGVDSYGELRCLDAATGERIWEDLSAVPRVRWGTIHIVRQGDRYWMFNDQGQLTIARLTPEGYEPLSHAQLISPTTNQLPRRQGVTWSHPAYANRHIFIRNDQEIISVSLAADPEASQRDDPKKSAGAKKAGTK